MKKLPIGASLVVATLYCMTSLLFAQDRNTNSAQQGVPIVPISIGFRRVSQLFTQKLDEPSKYSSITAFVDNTQNPPSYEIVLRVRASSLQVYYSNSQKTVGDLKSQGREAYYAVIGYQSSGSSGSDPMFQFQFHDSSGESIEWQFKVGPPKDSANTKATFMDRPDDPGFVLLRLNRPMTAAPGTQATVDNESYPAGSDALYSENVLMARIEPTTEAWNVSEGPSQFSAGSNWVAHDSNGQQRMITIQRSSGDQLTLRQEDSKESGAAPMLIDALQLSGLFEVGSLTAQDRNDTLHISFEPPLPLPAYNLTDKNQIKFTIDEDGDEGVASGMLTATRGLGDEHLTWHFSSPVWARSLTFDSGVNFISGSGVKQHQKTTGSM